VKNPSASSTVARGKTKISSWTTTPEGPHFSAFTDGTPGTVSILLVAETQGNNFFLNPGNVTNALFPFRGLSMIRNEQEVIGYGPINVIEASFLYVGSAITFQEEETLYQEVPKTIPKKYVPGQDFIEADKIKPVFKYIDNVLKKYQRAIQSIEFQYLKRRTEYLLLKQGSNEGIDLTKNAGFPNYMFGMRGGQDVFARIEAQKSERLWYLSDDAPRDIINDIVGHVKNNPDRETIQAKLLAALDLQIRAQQ